MSCTNGVPARALRPGIEKGAGRGGAVYVGGTDGIARLTLQPKNVHGTARYTFFPATATGIDYTYPADKQLRPIRGARVLLWDQNANKAIDHFMAHGPGARSVTPPRLHSGERLPAALIATAGAALERQALMPARGYLND